MIFFLPTLLLLIIGWLIKYKKASWLISGYNTASEKEKQQYDEEKLCRYMGNFLFILAGIFLVMAVASVLINEYLNIIALIGSGAVLLVTIGGIIYLNTGNRVKKK